MTAKPDTYRVTVNTDAIVASAVLASCASLPVLRFFGIRWRATDPVVRRAGVRAEVPTFARTIIPLSFVSMTGPVLSARLDSHDRPVRKPWMRAVWLCVAKTAFASGYVIPQNTPMIWNTYSAGEAANVRATWLGLHVIRVVIAFAGPVYALIAALTPMERHTI
ncbi:MAG: hypothetical protein WBA67_04015 [Jannaschia sp.]